MLHRVRKESSVIMHRNLLKRVIKAAGRRTPTWLWMKTSAALRSGR